MKQILLILILIAAYLNLFSQTVYSGFIDNFPIELVTYTYSDNDVKAIYTYTRFDEPIVINGQINKGTLTLYETNGIGKNKAELRFNNYDSKTSQLEGTWIDLNLNKQFKISLTKKFEIVYGENPEGLIGEILQPFALKDRYFKLVISKLKNNMDASVTAVKIFEKKTDKLIQKIDVECQLWGLNNLLIDDYNFDGIDDFSVFEQNYSGPNTSRLYFLYNPKTNNYFNSGFSGTSLEFDSKAKRIYEHNQCCSGRSHMNAVYKVVNNKMVLVSKNCLEFDETTEDFKEVKCE